MKISFFSSLMLFVLPLSTVRSQDIISVSLLDISTQEETSQINPLAQNDVEMYRLLYSTLDENNEVDTASGLLSIPVLENESLPLLCYQHGTVSGRNDVPSNLEGGYQLNLALASVGYITFTPDLQGLGTSKGSHSYVHSQSTSTYSLDMLIAVQDYLSNNTIPFMENEVYITGYSQGGHSAMAFHKYLEEHPEYDISVIASAPMSGPYSVSDVMLNFTLGEEEYFTPSYIANIAISYNRHYQLFDELSDFFVPPYLNKIEEYANEEISLGTLNTYLINTLNQNEGGVYTKNIIKDDILDSLFSSYPNPIRLALEDNDLFDWTPIAPMQMMYCGSDEQVSFLNATTTEQAMINNGATNVQAINLDEEGTHGSCIAPATIQTLIFFAGLNNPTETTDPKHKDIEAYPNPASEYIEVAIDSKTLVLSLQDINGRPYKIDQFEDQKLSVSELPPGIYFLVLSQDNMIRRVKFIKQ